MDENADVMTWLRDGDPAIHWQVLQDLTDAPAAEVAAARARVTETGWGARLLAEQGADGLWDGGTYRPGWVDESRPMYDAWTATHFSLQQLRDCGVDPEHPDVVDAIARVAASARWDHAGEPYFDGETEPCINGVLLSIAAYFGKDSSPAAETLVRGQLADGGWNCDGDSAVSSAHSTICAVEGLSDWVRVWPDPRFSDAVLRGEEYLLERRLLWRRSDDGIIDPRFGMPSYPVRWYYDVLRGLEHFRRRDRRDPRLADAVEFLRARRRSDGRWCLENVHEGPTLFRMEGEDEGCPSRWVTLRALRVLRWWDAS